MSIALSEFWTRLVQNGIVDPAGYKRFAAQFSAAHDGRPPGEAKALARFLVQAEHITAFQARALLSDAGTPIRIGRFVQSSDQPSLPLGHWLPVRTAMPNPIGQAQNGFLLRVPVAQQTDYLNQWLAAHAAVVGESLQPFTLYGGQGSELEIFSRLELGQSLSQVLESNSIDRRQAIQIGISVADALTVMHSRSLLHGEVRPDRIWVTNAGETVLLRDPSTAPRVPRADHSLSWLNATESPGAYAAPEFADPNQICTPATDIYSLGCLLFRMIVGRDVVAGESVDEQISAQISEVPEEVSAAVAAGESGDSVLRVAGFAMAKHPSARFAATQQISDALNAVLAAMPQPSSQPDPGTTVVKTPPEPQPAVQERPASTETVVSDAASQSAVQRQAAKRQAEPRTGQMSPRQSATTSPSTPSRQPKTDVQESPPRAAKPAEAPAAQVTPQSPQGRSSATEPAAVSGPPPVAEQPPEPPPGVPTEQQEARRARRKRKKKKSTAPIILGALAIPALALLAIVLVYEPAPPERKRKERPPIPSVVPPVASSTRNVQNGSVGNADTGRRSPGVAAQQTPTAAEGKNADGYRLMSEGGFLWAPPYAAGSSPASLDLLPPGPAVIATARLNRLITGTAGRKIITAFSPELAGLIKQAADRGRVKVQSINRLTVGLYRDKDGWPEVALVIELLQPKTAKELSDSWQASAARTPEGATIYAGDEPNGDAFYLGDSEKGAHSPEAPVTRFAVGSVDLIKAVAENEGGGIPLPRALQKLWDTTSVEADFLSLVTPNFLFADGREMLQTAAPELIDPLKNALVPDFAGTMITASLDDTRVYMEMRGVPSGDLSSAALMAKMSNAIKSWQGWAEGFVVDAEPDRSWKLLATRLPQMMRFYLQQTRFGIDGDTVVANTYLPDNAATQISIATFLAMNTKPGVALAANGPVSEKPLTLEEMLNRKMSISFDQLSLEFAINEIVSEFSQSLPSGSVMPPVRLIGSDLQKNGITQNQQIRDFSKADIPLRTVLTDLVRGANPDKTAVGADDPKQALVWALVETPGGTEIYVTTRQAADGQYELPNEFVIKN